MNLCTDWKQVSSMAYSGILFPCTPPTRVWSPLCPPLYCLQFHCDHLRKFCVSLLFKSSILYADCRSSTAVSFAPCARVIFPSRAILVWVMLLPPSCPSLYVYITSCLIVVPSSITFRRWDCNAVGLHLLSPSPCFFALYCYLLSSWPLLDHISHIVALSPLATQHLAHHLCPF